MLLTLRTVSVLVLASAAALLGCDDDDGTSDNEGGAAGSSQAGRGGSSAAGSSATGGRGGSGAGGSSATGGSGGESGAGNVSAMTSFFVSSEGSATGNLGGLVGADARCQRLAAAVGLGQKTWRAYLSVESDPSNNDLPTDARDRIGSGPWYNSEGVLLASDLDELHSMVGNAELFLDETGEKVSGQWAGSPTPNEHDILTGSTADGTVRAGYTCADWTSESEELLAQVGHSDGLGPMMNSAPPYASWNSSHENGGCHDTAPKGGAGFVYCFTAD